MGGEFLIALQSCLGLRLARLGIRAHPFQLAFQRLGERVLLALLLRQALSLLFQPGGIIALPGYAVAAVEFENPFRDIVEKVSIMRDRDDGARVFLEEVFEPGYRLRIQVVGGFVEQQHVGFRQQQPAQSDPALLAAGQLADHGVPGRQAQRVCGNFELALQFPAAHRVDLVLHLRLLFHELVHFIVRHRFGKSIADGIESIDQALDVADAFADHLTHRSGLIEQRLLRQVADFDAGLRPRFAFDFLVESGHDLEQGGLAGAVQTQHADLRARKEAQRYVA